MRAAVNLLRGVKDERLERTGLAQSPTFGILSEQSDRWLMQALFRCVTAGWISFAGDDRPLVLLTDSGRAVMKGERPARVLLPGPLERGSGSSRHTTASDDREDLQPLDELGETVFAALRAWRQETARINKAPAYVVAHDRTLREIALARPRSEAELALVWGLGPGKQEKYGEAILDCVQRAVDAGTP